MTHRTTVWRHRKFGPPRPLEPCGTWAAAKRHQRSGEPLDAACQEAVRTHNAEMYSKRKQGA